MCTNSLYIVMPAYNEEANIEKTLSDWYPVVEKIGCYSRLVVFDDGSKDTTFEIMLKFAEDHPLFIPQSKTNSGHGATLLDAYKFALESGADYIFQTDSDGQTDPNEFWALWKKRSDFDMVIGWRKTRQDGFSRIIVAKTLKAIIKMHFGVKVADANCPFRLMSASTLATNIEFIPKDSNLSNVLLSVIYTKRKQKVEFIPITFKPRQGGVNTINLASIAKIGKSALADFKSLNKQLNDMLPS